MSSLHAKAVEAINGLMNSPSVLLVHVAFRRAIDLAGCEAVIAPC